MEKRTVLFVDDEEKVLSCLEGGLVDEPYKTLFASSGKEALEILKQNEVQVIVTDMRMPGMGGLELLRIVKENYPHIIRMVLSGYADIKTLLAAINQGEIFRFITKPWDFEKEFIPAVRQATDYYDLHSEREMLMRFVEQVMDDNEPDKVNLRLIQAIISKHKKQLGQWREACDSVQPAQEQNV
ncbi:MAG: response regulator [Candidatus Hermodarchaeia archaeon]|jgi:DNA-binding NtrC family response regulator